MLTNAEMQSIRQDFTRISKLMEKGIQTEERTGKQYFTGYCYNTLYDWDQYFEAIVQLYLGWDTVYAKNGVTIFLDYQDENGFIMRRIPASMTEESKKNLDETSQNIMFQEDKEMVKPFLSQIALLIYKCELDLSWLTPVYYDKLKRYIEYWITEMDKNKNGLSTWNSGPHSGMDDQIERVGGWGACISEGVDLNSFLYRECVAFSIIADIMGMEVDQKFF